MKKLPFLILAFLFSILTKTFGQNYADVQGTWNGTATLVEKLSGEFATSERHIVLNIKDNKVTGTVKYSADVTVNGNKWHDECFGIGAGELISVNIRTWDGTYDINIEGPECKLVAGGGNSGDGLTGIGISDKKLQLVNGQPNTTVLSGTETTTRDVPNMGTFTRTITWHLVSSLDVELIVTPIGYDITGAQKNYDDWLPEPGKDETNKGSYMKIKLKLQSKSGKPLKYKAQSFELKLSNTSIEPGITINYPLNPQPNQLPDLRFIPLAVAESDDQDQYITVSCLNGTTGEAFIASYDGGGATTLTVEATLEGGIHIKGQLLVSGGDEDIQVPKRLPGTMIATAWLAANGNLVETDDLESTKGNSNIGDGLTVYEEYRGVISEAEFGKSNPNKFGRLDPLKKEVGVRVDKAEIQLFLLGIKWFENATSLKVIRFNETEIGNNRRLNKNEKTAHVFDQYVLILYKGLIGGALGSVYTSNTNPDIPANTFSVVIDIDAVNDDYTYDVNKEKPNPLPFTLAEFIANVVAHELGHGVSAWHHGQTPDLPSPDVVDPGPPLSVNGYANKKWTLFKPPSVRIFDRNGVQLSLPYTIKGVIGQKGNTESGDLSCIMAYVPYCSWSYMVGADGAWIFNEVPFLNVGKKMCTSPKGTSINAGIVYFGDAIKGNCLSQIKLK